MQSPYTFITPDGLHFKVIDYIFNSPGIIFSPKSVSVALQVYIGSGLDHFPISACFSVPPISNRSRAFKRRRLPFNQGLVGNPKCDQAFFTHFKNNCPSISSQIEPTSQYHIVVQAAIDAASSAYPLKSSKGNSKYVGREICLSQTTAQAIAHKAKVFSCRQKFFCRMSNALLYKVFGIWSSKCKYAFFNVVYGFGHKNNLQQWCRFNNLYISIKRRADMYCTLEDKVYFSDKDEALYLALAEGPLPQVHEALKPFARKAAPNQCTVKVSNEDGIPATSLSESKLIFRELFKTQQCGKEITFEQLVHLDRLIFRNSPLTILILIILSILSPSLLKLCINFLAPIGTKPSGRTCFLESSLKCFQNFVLLFYTLYCLNLFVGLPPRFNGREVCCTSCSKIKGHLLTNRVTETSC